MKEWWDKKIKTLRSIIQLLTTHKTSLYKEITPEVKYSIEGVHRVISNLCQLAPITYGQTVNGFLNLGKAEPIPIAEKPIE